MDIIAELRKGFKYMKRESKNMRVGPCPECNSKSTLSVACFPGAKVKLGTFHCWECGYSGSWNDLAKRLGLQKKEESSLTENAEVTLSQINYSNQYKHPPRITKKRWRGDWRGVPEKIFRALEAKLWLDVTNYSTGDFRVKKRIYLPVLVDDEEVGYIGALVKRNFNNKKSKIAKYKNSPGEWAKKYLYPYDFVCPSKITVLVEGPFDALWLISHGIPALCFLGVENWTYKKTSWLVAGEVTTVIPLLDNDKAGDTATKRMVKDLKKASIEIQNFVYSSQDPGKMTSKELKRLRLLIKECS